MQPNENFAERWAGDRERVEEFFDWIEAASEGFTNLGADAVLDRMIIKMAATFGDRPARTAAATSGLDTWTRQRAGNLGVAPGAGQPARRRRPGLTTAHVPWRPRR